MPLLFSPLTENLLDPPSGPLYPKAAFVMRQIGEPPELDQAMFRIVQEAFQAKGVSVKDADTTTGGKDFLERILGLVRATGFTVAIFSEHTRSTAMANIALELGFSAMCGKPILIVKTAAASAPSDLTRTDWIELKAGGEARFRTKLDQALNVLEELAVSQEIMLDVALDARRMDCAIAFERACKAFLITGDARLMDKTRQIVARLRRAENDAPIDDLDRLRGEIEAFLRQANRVQAAA